MAERLKDDMVGSLAYTLTVDGNIEEEFDAGDPLEYLHGAENIPPGLEAALQGKTVGDTFDVTVLPEDGYGEYDEDDVERIPRDEIEHADELEVGMEIDVFDEDGEMFEVVVKEITPRDIVLDFNMPLAGKTLHYKGKVVDVRPATDEERDFGWPQSVIAQMVEFEDYDDDDHDHNH